VLNYANVGATSLFTTAEDLARWVANLAAPRVGDDQTIARMCAPGKLNDGEVLDYACGLIVDEYRGLRRVGHSGGDAGYRSYVGRFPDQDLGVIVLSNLASFNPEGRAMDVAELYIGEQMNEPPKEQPAPALPPGTVARRQEAFRPTSEELAAYAGDYVSTELDTWYRLAVKGGTLVAEHSRHMDTPLKPLQKDRFVNSLLGRVVFERDPDGRINGLRASTGRVRNLRFNRRD
jgi:hypothetical protein